MKSLFEYLEKKETFFNQETLKTVEKYAGRKFNTRELELLKLSTGVLKYLGYTKKIKENTADEIGGMLLFTFIKKKTCSKNWRRG